ncbi:MAG: ABC transporter ATP-binding protein [Gloeobacterales cyanobacterium]
MVAPSTSPPSEIYDPKRPIIEIRGLKKRFGNKVILDGIDLDIYSGEAVAIVGPSGTGKSTILRIICGLLAPDEGTVRVGGHEISGNLAHGEAMPFQIGMVFQQAALFDSLNVDENVGFILYQHSKLPKERIRALVKEKLALVGLSGTENLFPAELSGGMRTRVSFARAIMEDPNDPDDQPRILLYDEPTAGLDPIASTRIEDVIRELWRDRSCESYIIVTHQDSTIRRAADRIILLYDGKVQWIGKTSEIDETDNPFVKQFFAGLTEGPIQPNA